MDGPELTYWVERIVKMGGIKRPRTCAFLR
jgi:hypothetical protein